MHTAVSDAGIAPTTSNKEEIESTIPFLSKNGVKIHIGKGMLNNETKKLNEGIEALYKLKVENIPGIVAIAHGKSI